MEGKNTKERKISENEKLKIDKMIEETEKTRSDQSTFFICENDMRNGVEVRRDGSWFQSIQTSLSVDNLQW